MGVRRINCTQEEFSFPKLMINKNTGTIALFQHSKLSMVVVITPQSGSTKLGELLTSDAGYWQDYNEPLTLKNE